MENLTNKEEAIVIAEKEFEELIKKYLPVSNSINDLCSKLGLRGTSGYYLKILETIRKNRLSTEHFGTILKKRNIKIDSKGKFAPLSDEEFFSNGTKRNGESIVKRLISNKYREYKCENCGINEWDGKPLRLQVHHVNGDHNDNRIENIQLLCPNCHAQTDTYARNNITNVNSFKITNRIDEILNGLESTFEPMDIEEVRNGILPPKEKKYCQLCGKKIIGDGEKYCSYECAEKARRKFEVTSEQLIKDFKEIKSFTGVGKKYNVSDNAIKRRTKKLGIYDEIRQFITQR